MFLITFNVTHMIYTVLEQFLNRSTYWIMNRIQIVVVVTVILIGL